MNVQLDLPSYLAGFQTGLLVSGLAWLGIAWLLLPRFMKLMGVADEEPDGGRERGRNPLRWLLGWVREGNSSDGSEEKGA